MRILDIDLDFFLSKIEKRDVEHEEDSRPENNDPWTETKVRRFLEERCLLNQKAPIAGAIVEEHSEVYDRWRTLVNSRTLIAPFEVVHIDAHADMGGRIDGCHHYLMTEWLGNPVAQRQNPKCGGWSGGLTSGNYLLFAIACQWISALTYIHHPLLRRDEYGCWEDLLSCIFKNNDLQSGAVQLEYYGYVDDNNIDVLTNGTVSPIATEPEVPFTIASGEEYQAEKPFDMLFLAQSLKYTPKEADNLIKVFHDYIVPKYDSYL